MKIKKILVTTLATAMLISGTIGSVGAAGNYQDESFNFEITSSKKSTVPRKKLDNTSATIRITKGTGSATVIVNGLKTSTSRDMVDCTYGTHKTVRKSDTYTYLPNLVYEKKGSNGKRLYPYANLSLRSAISSSWDAKGLWSPDSI